MIDGTACAHVYSSGEVCGLPEDDCLHEHDGIPGTSAHEFTPMPRVDGEREVTSEDIEWARRMAER